MIKIGIDPGLSGGFAFCKDDKIIGYFETPTQEVPYKKTKTRRVIDLVELIPQIEEYVEYGETVAVIEKVGAMPGQGVTSMFRFGETYGIVQGVMAAMRIPILYAHPHAWKAQVGLVGEDKQDSVKLANQMLHLSGQRLTKHLGVSDAVLISLYDEE